MRRILSFEGHKGNSGKGSKSPGISKREEESVLERGGVSKSKKSRRERWVRGGEGLQ